MITKKQALDADRFHYGECSRETGPRGGVTEHVKVWRRTGSTKLWKTRPDEFRVPVQFGMRARDHSYITQDNAWDFHTEDECPLEG